MNISKAYEYLDDLDSIHDFKIYDFNFDDGMKNIRKYMRKYCFHFSDENLECYVAEFKFYYVPLISAVIRTICENEKYQKLYDANYAFDIVVENHKCEIRPARLNNYSEGFEVYDINGKITSYCPADF